ncbi:unnamed protein product [Callosobruchus maculatus]|uniref:C3H1-type domain-containing protein n=1 Tax=Callosobruchus maculatus TaxID=64391 RepID=A0A653DQZ1_CALMS|nr:unnamed protein product [Callosobruchus maculatus]
MANVLKLAIPKLACGRDGLDWRIIRNVLEVLLRFTGIEILVCSWNPRELTEHRTVYCFFCYTSGCKKGVLCQFRHERFGDETALRRGSVPVRPWTAEPIYVRSRIQTSRSFPEPTVVAR